MERKFRIIIISVSVFVLTCILGYFAYLWVYNKCCDLKPIVIKTTLTHSQRVADPELIYSSTSWKASCLNENQEKGGCYTDMYFYSDGRLEEASGFISNNSVRQDNPTTQIYLSRFSFDEIIEQISSSGIMAKKCSVNNSVDSAYDYQIRLDGVKKTFHNPPQDCKSILDGFDSLINSLK
jgi:hypothetical protein